MKEDIEVIGEYEASCNGDKVNGHPLIYFHLQKDEEVTCPYCSRKFKQKS